MKNPDALGDKYVLSGAEHEIMLGTLKKIEAKNGAFLAILAIVLTGFINKPDLIAQAHHLVKVPALLSFGALLGITLHRISGASHLGQIEFSSLQQRKEEAIWASELQKQLAKNLIEKECNFTASIRVLKIAIILIVLSLVASALCQHISNDISAKCLHEICSVPEKEAAK